ncbi:unnamed protein product [Paramecium sonneborni]|uniref:Uncharacterized protein n=1 Tax=Paramecium sonneborni TaxID=65129 RepID=A0A8S1RC71_9CILI|nr:unnamed protein product [Paramecium sonneborni]
MSRDMYESKSKRKNDKRKQNQQSPIADYENDKKKVGRWTPEEDEKLQKLIEEYGEKSWRIISDMMEGRSAIQCLHRWTKILKPGLKKGPWQDDEDEKLLEWVKNNGPCKWSLCAENIAGRSGKQCRERWFNNLNPNVKKGGWTSEEDHEIFKGYLQYSSSWSKIAKNLSGRTENSVKNRFYSTVRKLLADQEKNGISLKMLEAQGENGTSALQTFVKEHLQKYEQQMQMQIEQEEPDSDKSIQEEKLEESEIKSEDDDDDSKSRKKIQAETYQEQNLLYRLLKQQGGPIKRTSCMKDYSTIYKKYKKRYNQKKKDKKLSDKVENLRKMILKKDDYKNSSEEKELDFQQNLEQQLANFSQQKIDAQSQNGDSDKMNEFQEKLLAFFNQQLNEVMKKFYVEMGDPKQAKWQMILAPDENKIQQQQQQQQQQQLQENKKKTKRQIAKSVKVKEEEDEQNQMVMNTFLQKFNHLGQIGITQLGANVNEGKNETENQMVQDAKIDQKMMFLISQLHTLENMLGDTKKEFSRLEASLYEKINNTSFHSNNSSEKN